MSVLESVFLGCAVVGGVFFLLRTTMLFFGFGGDDATDAGNVAAGDIPDASATDAAHSSGGDFRIFSLHGLTSFFFLFGLTGWLLLRDGVCSPVAAGLWGIGVGVVAMVASAVCDILRLAHLTSAQCTADLHRQLTCQFFIGNAACAVRSEKSSHQLFSPLIFITMFSLFL